MTNDTHSQQKTARPSEERKLPTVSAVLEGKKLVELVYDAALRRTRFAVWNDGDWRYEDTISLPPKQRLVPYSAENNLIKNEVVLLPSEPAEYGSEEELVKDIQGFIHRYVDVSPRFERIASYYVLFSWLFDRFAELPYLRLRGDYGSGKTRGLLTIGAICYKPIFASGATSTSAIFRILDAFGGTLIIDEGDFRFSDEKTDLVKILNNGNVKGMPVLRTEMSGDREFNPRAFQVFGPKLVASRGFFDDKALESRFITEEVGERELRRDIPINMPASQRDEARELRNKLLLYRFRNFEKERELAVLDESIEPRLRQIFIPLTSIVNDETVRKELGELALSYNRELRADRAMEVEAQVLEVIRELAVALDRPVLGIKDITILFLERYGSEYNRHITNKWIGTIVRRRLHLKTQKSHGNFIISQEERPKLKGLYEKYGLIETRVDEDLGGTSQGPSAAPEGDIEDTGDVAKVEDAHETRPKVQKETASF